MYGNFFSALAFLAGIFAPAILFSQPDLPKAGVIVVKRPPVPADYAIKLEYDYSRKWSQKRFWERRYTSAVRTYKAWLTPPAAPVPVSGSQINDSIAELRDSAKIAHSVLSHDDNPVHTFNWDSCLQLIAHTFAWSDSIQLDSAQFFFRVDKNGQSSFMIPPGEKNDSLHLMQLRAAGEMRHLWLWYPAQQVNNKNSQLMNIPCTVKMTVYAYGVRNSKKISQLVQVPKKK